MGGARWIARSSRRRSMSGVGWSSDKPNPSPCRQSGRKRQVRVPLAPKPNARHRVQDCDVGLELLTREMRWHRGCGRVDAVSSPPGFQRPRRLPHAGAGRHHAPNQPRLGGVLSVNDVNEVTRS
eukprot:508532-Rhodomonas_salina.3